MEKVKVKAYLPKDYAKIKGVCLKTVYNWMSSGKLGTTRKLEKTLVYEK